MNISAGLSVIDIPRTSASARTGKIYLWPAYDRGPVHKVPRVSRDDSPWVIINNVDPSRRDDIIASAAVKSDVQYLESGRTMWGEPSQPGSLFDAWV
jgi:hypothetical protein